MPYQKKYEALLQEFAHLQYRHELLVFVSQKTDNAVIITDAEGLAEWVNEGFTRLSGYTLEDVAGRKPGQLLQGKDTDKQVVRYLGTQIRQKKTCSAELLNYNKEGKPYWVRLEIHPLFDAQGALRNFIALQLDISEQKAQALALQEAKEAAERANKAKSDFLSNISHEIRTPLNAIVSLVELLQEEELSSIGKKNAQTIQYASHYLLHVIQDILDFSKIEAGKIQLQEEAFDLIQRLDKLVGLVRIKAVEKKLVVESHVATNIPALLQGDWQKISQILLNLLYNAVKFTEKGQVQLRVSLHKQEQQRVWLCWEVEDTGIGIAAAQLPYIFQSFTQVFDQEQKNYSGTGLGLAISQKLAQAMGGQIEVESRLGEGSLFRLYLPLKVGKRQSQAPLQELVLPLQSKVFLLVEDNEINQMVYRQLFKRWQITLHIASNGKEALQMIEQRHFDLILMDLQMPEMNGFEATKLIRSGAVGAENAHIPIIALTADALSQTQKQVKKAGMNYFLSKPVSQDRLLQGIHACLQAQEQLRMLDLRFVYSVIGDDAEMLQEILTEFLHSTPRDLQHLQKMLSTNTPTEAAALAHKLKSTFKDLGMDAALKVAQHIEEQCLGQPNTDPDLFVQWQQLWDFYEMAAQEAAYLMQKV
jgi:PAS domain S-box-containing protein